MNNTGIVIIILLVLFGLSSRIFTFQSVHPDSDEMFELRNMQNLSLKDVIKQNTFYGDHTSFPGEYLIHYLPMKVLNLFEKPAKIDIEQRRIEGIDKTGFWVLAIPKILITLLSFVLFWLVCQQFLKTTLGHIIAFSLVLFNGHLIYHAFSLRPYGILPELAIINLFLASRDNKERWFYIVHIVTIFFTCINHAYGPMIAVLPVLFFRKERYRNMWLPVCVSLSCWMYYAAYSTFGMTPNKVQSQVDTFQFITRQSFLEDILKALFGTSLITAAAIPFVMIGVQYLNRNLLNFFLLLILLPLSLIILVDIKTHYWIHPRQFIWLLPAIGLWCAMLTETYLRKESI